VRNDDQAGSEWAIGAAFGWRACRPERGPDEIQTPMKKNKA